MEVGPSNPTMEKGHLPWHSHIPQWLNRNSPPPWAMCWSLRLFPPTQNDVEGNLNRLCSLQWTGTSDHQLQINQFNLTYNRLKLKIKWAQVPSIWIIPQFNRSDLGNTGTRIFTNRAQKISLHTGSLQSQLQRLQAVKTSTITYLMCLGLSYNIISFKGLGLGWWCFCKLIHHR